MTSTGLPRVWLAAAALLAIVLSTVAAAQEKEKEQKDAPAVGRGRRGGPRGPVVVSPEVQNDRKVTFRILATKAETIRLNAGDIPGGGQERALTKGENNIWELTLGPIDPGAYRYVFDVDGVRVVDSALPQ